MEDLHNYLARHRLQLMGGDSDLNGCLWESKIYMVPVEGAPLPKRYRQGRSETENRTTHRPPELLGR
jgi:hypothetical protein